MQRGNGWGRNVSGPFPRLPQTPFGGLHWARLPRLNMPEFLTDGGLAMRTKLFVAVVLLCNTANAADYPKPYEADVILKDFRFAQGETLDLKVHYRTIGQPRQDETGNVLNAVLIVHGTTGSGAQFVVDRFAGELFGEGQPLDAGRYYLILPDAIGHGKSAK